MKSRVSKYADLHQKIASDTESTVENSDLSHFANRLNEIDDQFERVNTGSHDSVEPHRARTQELKSIEKKDPLVDTFETDYLKGFLDEVKEYNVKKGYRDISDTQANILDDLRSELQKDKSSQALVPDEFAQTQSIYSEKELAEIAREMMIDEEDLPLEDSNTEDLDLSETLVFGQEISLSSEEHDEEDVSSEDDIVILDDEESISDAILGMSYDDESDDDDDDYFEEKYQRNEQDEKLLEQTLTLQHKVLDLESNIEEMSASTSKTNQLLHVVLSLLLFAIIVVALLIVAQFL